MEPNADYEGPWLRSLRRRRHGDDVRYLLDSRLFRLLCAPGQEAALAGFRASLKSHGLAAGDRLPAFELTTFAFLDAIGLEPTQPDFFPLPPKVLQKGESVMATMVVAKLVQEQFREAPELQADALKKRVEELRQATEPAALDLFDLCVTQAVSTEGFQELIVRHLAFDFLYRFPFPEVLREEVFDFLCSSLFAAGEAVAAASMMRSIKVLWDRAYPWLLKRNPAGRPEIQALDKEMKLRTRKDYLGWEVVHYAILGLAIKGGFDRVTAFTPETAARLRARSIAHKSALRSFLDHIDPTSLLEISSKLQSWKPGTLVACRDDGTFEALLPTGDLPVYVGEKTAAG